MKFFEFTNIFQIYELEIQEHLSKSILKKKSEVFKFVNIC